MSSPNARTRRAGDLQGSLDEISFLEEELRIKDTRMAMIDAEPIRRECLEIRREALPESDWRIPHTKGLLGALLAGQGSFEAAEPLIMNGYHEIERSPDVPRVLVQKALLRIVDLYEAWGRPDKAAEWRAMLPNTDETEPAKP